MQYSSVKAIWFLRDYNKYL